MGFPLAILMSMSFITPVICFHVNQQYHSTGSEQHRFRSKNMYDTGIDLHKIPCIHGNITINRRLHRRLRRRNAQE